MVEEFLILHVTVESEGSVAQMIGKNERILFI